MELQHNRVNTIAFKLQFLAQPSFKHYDLIYQTYLNSDTPFLNHYFSSTITEISTLLFLVLIVIVMDFPGVSPHTVWLFPTKIDSNLRLIAEVAPVKGQTKC